MDYQSCQESELDSTFNNSDTKPKISPLNHLYEDEEQAINLIQFDSKTGKLL